MSKNISIDRKQKEIRRTVEAVFKAQRMIQEAMKEHLEVIEDIRASFEFLGEVFQQIKSPLNDLQVPYDLPAFRQLMEARQKITETSKKVDYLYKEIEDIEDIPADAEHNLLNYVNALKADLTNEKRKTQRLRRRLEECRKNYTLLGPKYVA
jgi:chromosome segregation ATPase